MKRLAADAGTCRRRGRAPRSSSRASARRDRLCVRVPSRARPSRRHEPRRAARHADPRRAAGASHRERCTRATARRPRSRARPPRPCVDRAARCDRARLGAVQDELGELIGLGLRTEPFERAGIARSEHPPTRPCARCRARAPAPRVRVRRRRSRSGDGRPRLSAAWSWVAPRCRCALLARSIAMRLPSSKPRRTYFPRRSTSSTTCPTSASGGGVTVFSAVNPSGSAPASR